MGYLRSGICRDAATAARGNMVNNFFQSVPADYEYTKPDQAAKEDNSRTLHLETKRHHANERYNQLLLDVMEMELRMGIQWWQPSHPWYQVTQKYISQQKYHQALNKVYRLVVLRLFELHKLNLSQTGEPSLITFALFKSIRFAPIFPSHFNVAAKQSVRLSLTTTRLQADFHLLAPPLIGPKSLTTALSKSLHCFKSPARIFPLNNGLLLQTGNM